MSQKTTFRALDAKIARVLARSGLTDAATYTPPTRGAAALALDRVMVDRNVQLTGADGQIVIVDATVTVFLADLSGIEPVHGGRFVVEGETFTVERQASNDGSRVVCVVKEGR